MRPDEAITHPSFCQREGCAQPQGDIVHRGPTRPPLTLTSDRGVVLGFEPVRCDELDDAGRQVVHDPEVWMTTSTAGPAEVISVERAEAILANLLGAIRSARGHTPTYFASA